MHINKNSIVHKNRHTGHSNREDSKVCPSATAIWFSTKVPRTFVGKQTFSSPNCAGETGFPHV
jgi:hypothetical protein